jgi:hypothetical protein
MKIGLVFGVNCLLEKCLYEIKRLKIELRIIIKMPIAIPIARGNVFLSGVPITSAFTTNHKKNEKQTIKK